MAENGAYIPFGRPAFGDDEVAAVTAALRSGWVGMGEQTLAFERELERETSAPHVVTVSSCTAALFLSLVAHHIGPGDDVVVPSLTWCSTANVALQLGARVVFCDIDPLSLVATPATVAAALTPRTRAVIVVHYGGLAADVDSIRAILPPDVALVEDAAHALGARYLSGLPVGSRGEPTCFSFYANKNLSTGEGGAVALADPEVADSLRSLRQHGMPANAWTRYIKPTHWQGPALTTLGYKLNYTDLQASIGRVQLRRQAEFRAWRMRIAERYAERLTRELPDAVTQDGVLSARHARHLFVLQLESALAGEGRDALIQRARCRGVGLSVHYAPLHRMPLYASERALPATDGVAGRLVSLPIGASMSDADVERVLDVVTVEVHGLRRERRTVIPLATVEARTPRVAPALASRTAYGFGGRLSAAFPSQILLDVSEICNLSCVHCPHPEFARSEHYGKRLLDPALNAKIVEEVATHGRGRTQYLRYASNGEPFTHPHLLEMLDTATARAGVDVALTTNGVLLTEARAERLVAAGVALVDISLDAATPETYAAIRVGGRLPKVEANVQRLIDLANAAGGRTKVVVSFVEQPGNQHETEQFDSMWRDRGASYVVIRRLHSCSGSKEALAVARRNAAAQEPRRPCLYPWERIGLNAGGHLFFCPSDWVHGSNLADYRTTTVAETWSGEAYRALRDAHVSNDYSCHAFCGQCPDWIATRWPHQGRSYADMVEDLRVSA